MIEELKQNLKNSYAPYSNFNVSAILITNDNKKYTGVNIENASYGATICAERVAIAKAISEGETKENFKEIHIMCSDKKPAMPCYLCRQVFIEFFTNNTKIYVYNIDGEKQEFSLEEICPLPFTKENLQWKVVSLA